jgi:hypothetical protein
MRILARQVEHPLGVPMSARMTPIRANIVGPPKLGNKKQGFHRGLPFWRPVLGIEAASTSRQKRAKADQIIRQALGGRVRLLPRFASMESPAYKTYV